MGPSRRPVLLGSALTALLAVPVTGAVLWQQRRSDVGSPSPAARPENPSPAPASTFTDVPADHPAAAAAAWADAAGVQPALEGGSYGPDVEVTRGQLAIALHRLAGAPEVPVAEAPAPISDVPSDLEAAMAVLWLHGHGALWGDAELRVHPEHPASLAHSRQVLTLLLEPALSGASLDPGILDDSLAAITEAGPAPRKGQAPLTRAGLALCLHRAVTALD